MMGNPSKSCVSRRNLCLRAMAYFNEGCLTCFPFLRGTLLHLVLQEAPGNATCKICCVPSPVTFSSLNTLEVRCHLSNSSLQAETASSQIEPENRLSFQPKNTTPLGSVSSPGSYSASDNFCQLQKHETD